MTQPKLTPAQQCVLRYLAAVPWTDHQWWSICSATKVAGFRHNARVTVKALMRRGLAQDGRALSYRITPAGIEAARQLRKDGE